ncbi:membrane protein [Yeosuana aromativorans]|uniref:Membrane protein n=1 Tax=Yeosuana aromativorans TaxID=288019 RepID=A0A8J3FF65_9FLAO|nr:RagB/SusD family nutrient uptake outer membrane protein [Yeosuana aromativorans]GGK18967.1 membrane protein [Yeosuana aromativorans]
MKTIDKIYDNALCMGTYCCSILMLLILVSCEDFIEVEAPKNELVGTVVFTDTKTAEAALSGIYSQMTEGFDGFANYRTTLLAGLYSDELDDYSGNTDIVSFHENSLNPNNSNLLNLWQEPYKYIYQANSVIEGLENTRGLDADIKQQFIGEALFIRAFCHFYLVNFFGDIPYIVTTDYIKNSSAVRQPNDEIYSKIVADLKEAIPLLPDFYVSDGRARPNTYAAQALLARVYLYLEDWENAHLLTTSVIGTTEHFELETNLDQVFLKDSREAIWQLQPVIDGLNTVEGFAFILYGVPRNSALSSNVLDAFDDGDLRKESWIGTITSDSDTYFYPYKYQVFFGSDLTEYYMVLRLAEQYLIRAEASAQLNNIEAAKADLNVIRNRAGLGDFLGNSKAELLEAIYKERQRELFAEWGHRWFDLKRTGKADAVLSVLKPGWQSTDTLFPIPQSELQNNPKISQNPGY